MSLKKAAEGLIKKGAEISEGLLNMVEMAFRAYDPCFGCATHTLPGEMPLEVVRQSTASDARGHLHSVREVHVSVDSTLVLGMGNPILSDDGVGLLVARRLAEMPLPDGVEVLESEVGGLRLLELVRGFTRSIIIDALKTRPRARRGRRAYEAKDFERRPSLRLRPLHRPATRRSSSAAGSATTMPERGRRCSPSRPRTSRRSARSCRRRWPRPPSASSSWWEPRWGSIRRLSGCACGCGADVSGIRGLSGSGGLRVSDASVVLFTTHRVDALRAALHGIWETASPHEIIVMVNGCDEQIAGYLMRQYLRGTDLELRLRQGGRTGGSLRPRPRLSFRRRQVPGAGRDGLASSRAGSSRPSTRSRRAPEVGCLGLVESGGRRRRGRPPKPRRAGLCSSMPSTRAASSPRTTLFERHESELLGERPADRCAYQARLQRDRHAARLLPGPRQARRRPDGRAGDARGGHR